MVKRCIIVHGWGGNPKGEWFPWIKKELTKAGFEVHLPEMPETDNPTIETWVSHLAKATKFVDKDTYFVGHSIGCQTILRYLETQSPATKVGGLFFVAGWFELMGLESEEELEIAEPWLKKAIDFNYIKKMTGRVVFIASDNDPFVSLANAKSFKEKLGAKVIIESAKGHFSASDKCTEIPVLLKEILNN